MNVRIFTRNQEAQAREFVQAHKVLNVTVTFDKLEVWYQS